MKRTHIFTSIMIATSLLLTGCFGGNKNKDSQSKLISVGYAQVGSESNWRIANTESFKKVFSEENGYQLFVDIADQKQEKQIESIEKFIDQKVDYIVIAPAVETGWEPVLQKAKEAGIPVILSDRQMQLSDDSLYLCWVGANFLKEGKESVKWLESYLKKIGKDKANLNIVDIQGTLGSSAQLGRTEGIEEGIKAHSNWTLIAKESGDFTEEGGKTVMQSMLKKNKKIDVVFAENDNMAWGAVEALKEAGLKPGKDVIIISFDAVHETLNRIIEGEINCTVECNPLHGSRVDEIIKLTRAGGTVDKKMYVVEGIFDEENAAQMLPLRKY